MRKLAREAIIFMLLTSFAAFTGGFVYLYRDARRIVMANSSMTLPAIDAKAMKTFKPAAPSDTQRRCEHKVIPHV